MKRCFIVGCLVLGLFAQKVQAGLWDVVDSARKSIGGVVNGCAWKFPNGKSCGDSTVGGSSYCEKHKCKRCNDAVHSGRYCLRHDPESHEMCIWPSCGEPGEIRFRHKGGTFSINGEGVPSKAGKYCKRHYDEVTMRLVEVGCLDFYPEVYARFDDETKKKIDAGLAARSKENAERKRKKFEATERAQHAEEDQRRIEQKEIARKEEEENRQYWMNQRKELVKNAQVEDAAKMAIEEREQAKIDKRIAFERKHNCRMSDIPLWKIAVPSSSGTKPMKNTAYNHIASAKIKQVTRDGVLVIIDGALCFITTDREYIDGDSLARGWYAYVGIYSYTDTSGANRTVRQFKEIEVEQVKD